MTIRRFGRKGSTSNPLILGIVLTTARSTSLLRSSWQTTSWLPTPKPHLDFGVLPMPGTQHRRHYVDPDGSISSND